MRSLLILAAAGAPWRGGRMAAVPRQSATDRRRHRLCSREPEAALDLRSRRSHRIVGRHFRRDRLRRVAIERSAGHRPRNREAALEIPRHRRHRGILPGRRRRRRLRGRPRRRAARRERGRRQGAVDLQDRSGDQVVAGDRRRPGPDRLLRRQPLLPLPRATASCSGNSPPATTCTRRRPLPAASPTCPVATKSFTASASPTARNFCNSLPAATPAPPWRCVGDGLSTARSAMRWSASMCARSASSGATSPAPQFPFYSSAAVGRGPHRGRRPRQADPLPEREDRQGDLDVRHPRPRRFVAGDRGRSRLRGLQRRPFLRAGPRRRKEAVGFRCRRSAVGVPRHRRGARGHRLAGRTAVLLRAIHSRSRPVVHRLGADREQMSVLPGCKQRRRK